MRPRSQLPLFLVVPLSIAFVSVSVSPLLGAEQRPVLGLGYEYDLSGAREEFLLPNPLVDPSITPDHPLYVRIRAPWSLIEPEPNRYAWAEIDRVIDAYRAAHFEVILSIHGAHPDHTPDGRAPTSTAGDPLRAWLNLTREAATHMRGRVRYYEIWENPNLEPGWGIDAIAEYAYVLKNTSITIRSADPEALIVQGGLALPVGGLEEALAWQEALYGQEVATYVDVLPVRPDREVPLADALSQTYELLLNHDPSAQLWANSVQPAGGSDLERAADLMARFIAGHGEGASVVSFDLEARPDGRVEFPGVFLDLHRLFLPTYSLVHGAQIPFLPREEDGERPDDVIAYQFFDADSFQGLIGFVASPAPSSGEARLVVNTAAVRGAVVYDIVGGVAGPVRGIEPDFKANTTTIPVTLLPRPQVLQYARVPIEGFETDTEEVAVHDTGLITAEEVIAENQRFMADQDHRLRNYRADGRVEYHYKISGSNTLDVATDNNFYWDETTGAEWEQRELFVNGVRWKGKKIPELPLIQPEKVMTLPLDIHLNKDYRYEYAGTDRVGEYDCHVLEFEPIDTSRSLYSGRIWIEKRTFARVKLAVVQHNLEPPVISHDERDYYGPVAGPDGTTYWLLQRVEGQQIFSVAGRNLVVLREIDMSGFRINDPGFENARQAAYESSRIMLRDTDQGFRYLERDGEGVRTVREGTTHSTMFGLAGLFKQPGLDSIVPLAGVNYFTFGLRDSDLQMNAFLAGAFNTFTLTNPDIFNSQFDATVEVLTLLPNLTDRFLVLGEERESSNVDTRTQSISGSLGVRLGSFFRLKGSYNLEVVNYSRDDDTSTFIVPSDTLTHGGTLDAEFNRRGWTLSASASRSLRDTWEPWGDEGLMATDPEIIAAFPGASCNSPGSCLADFDPAQDDFERYSLSASKQIFLPKFQKLRFEATWMRGTRLDRFSAFQFSFFGTRVRGLSGAGVRFDDGTIVRAQYAFNVFDVLRFGASLDHGRVRNSLLSDQFERFTGFGLSGTIMGPWETLLQFDIGVAVQSDIEDLEGETEFLIGLLKLF